MPWAKITEDDIHGAMGDQEADAIRGGLAVSGGENDPFDTVRRQVTDAFRGAIRSGPGNRLDADAETLPAGAVFHAVAKIRYRLLTRYAPELIDEDRRTENREAESWLKEVRRGIEKIEQPDESPGANVQPSIALLSNHERQATRQNLSGL